MTTTNFPLGDFLIRIKNQALAKGTSVRVPKTKMIIAVANTMKDLGYLREVEVVENDVQVFLNYRKKEPVLMGLTLMSKPGLRVYMSADELSAKKGPTVYLVSTSKGVKDSKTAIKERLGGEILAQLM